MAVLSFPELLQAMICGEVEPPPVARLLGLELLSAAGTARPSSGWRTGLLTARASMIERGRTVGLVECRVAGRNERLVAHATSTCMVLRGDAASGR